IDPLFVTTADEIDIVTNLFTGLTRTDPQTGEVIGALAESWSFDDDSLAWTFVLRDDVAWVRYDAVSDEILPVRTVTAQDVLFTFQRLCSSVDNGYYATEVFASLLAGCVESQNSGDVSVLEASAPDEVTFTIRLTGQYGYFLSMSRLWTIYPVPQDVVNNQNWTQPGTMLSSGAYVLTEDTDDRLVLRRNSLYPADLWQGGNLAQIEIQIVADVFEQTALYAQDLIDWTAIPPGDVEAARDNPEYRDITQQSVFYIGFVADKAPFDDVYVRRAFAAMFDRAMFMENVVSATGSPIAHFTPPGLEHAPPQQADFDVGYDPAYANQQLAQSTYPGCLGMPPITARTFQGGADWVTFLAQQIREIPGCETLTFDIEEVDSVDALQTLLTPQTAPESRPHLFTLGWAADYNDADSFATFLMCGANNPTARNCSELDEVIVQARQEIDSTVRESLYMQIEAGFFGAEGEFPLIPISTGISHLLVKPWLQIDDGMVMDTAGQRYDAYVLMPDLLPGSRISCEIGTEVGANLRFSPTTDAGIGARLFRGDIRGAIGQVTGSDGFIWWQLESGLWVRADVVITSNYCLLLPTVTP
ncbi:MAG: ABC transporter substrate-binding protein, partial [Aggregatilineales bacterium]